LHKRRFIVIIKGNHTESGFSGQTDPTFPAQTDPCISTADLLDEACILTA
jgi:hypothetical protein